MLDSTGFLMSSHSASATQTRKAAMRAVRQASWNPQTPPTIKLSPHPIRPSGPS
jgi:hypothetical protein